MSSHINNPFAKKSSIGKKLLLTFPAVMLGLQRCAWRRPCGNDRKPTSIIEEAFADTDLLVPPGPPPLWGPGAGGQANGLMHAGFSSHQIPTKSGKYDYTAFL